jgi:hypothetical protein
MRDDGVRRWRVGRPAQLDQAVDQPKAHPFAAQHAVGGLGERVCFPFAGEQLGGKSARSPFPCIHTRLHPAEASGAAADPTRRVRHEWDAGGSLLGHHAPSCLGTMNGPGAPKLAPGVAWADCRAQGQLIQPAVGCKSPAAGRPVQPDASGMAPRRWKPAAHHAPSCRGNMICPGVAPGLPSLRSGLLGRAAGRQASQPTIGCKPLEQDDFRSNRPKI